MVESSFEITYISINLKIFLLPKRVISIFKICSNAFITYLKDSKLLTMYNFDYSDHTDVNYHVSEYLNVKMKSAQKSCFRS